MLGQSQTPCIQLVDFGLSDYEVVYAQQQAWLADRIAGRTNDVLLLGEHLEVITCGRRTQKEHLLAPDCPVIEIERGGNVTWHGPGQLVAYPIRALPPGERDLHRYLRQLESVVIKTLDAFGLKGFRREGMTGVWIQQEEMPYKIASIGVAVRKWVTWHGVSLNVTNDLERLKQINPCGMDPSVMTSMQKALPDVALVMDGVKKAFVQAYHQVMNPSE